MTYVRMVMLMILGLAVSACASVETATRNAPLEPIPTEMRSATPSFHLADFQVIVPEALQASEANSYFPAGDIVWRGDAPGNRHAQVQAIFDNSIRLGLTDVDGALPVRVEIVVKRFHALTEKTRYTVGGIHNIVFDVTLRDPVSGAVIRGPVEIKANLEGYGGQQAIEADAKGLTQKYRITQHLARVLREEMTLATGYIAPRGGITRRITPI